MDKVSLPISIVVTVLLALISFLGSNAWNQQKDTNKALFESQRNARDAEAKITMDFEKRLTLIEYMIREKGGRYE